MNEEMLEFVNLYVIVDIILLSIEHILTLDIVQRLDNTP